MEPVKLPLLVVRQSLSPNPLFWFKGNLAMVYRWLLPTIAAMAGIFLVADTPSERRQVILVFGPYLTGVFVIALSVSLWLRVRANRNCYRFYAEHVAVETRIKKSEYYFDIEYRRVNHIVLTDEGVIRLDREGAVESKGVFIDVGRHRAADTFDFLVEHLERTMPDHLFSIVENGLLRYSGPWDWMRLYPWQLQVDSAALAVTSMRAGEREYTARYEDGYVVGRADVETPRDLLVTSRSCIRHGNGMILVLDVRVEPDLVSISFDEDTCIAVRKSDGTIRQRDETVGVIHEAAGEFNLEADRALPELQWLAVLGAYADARRSDRMRDALAGN